MDKEVDNFDIKFISKIKTKNKGKFIKGKFPINKKHRVSLVYLPSDYNVDETKKVVYSFVDDIDEYKNKKTYSLLNKIYSVKEEHPILVLLDYDKIKNNLKYFITDSVSYFENKYLKIDKENYNLTSYRDNRVLSVFVYDNSKLLSELNILMPIFRWYYFDFLKNKTIKRKNIIHNFSLALNENLQNNFFFYIVKSKKDKNYYKLFNNDLLKYGDNPLTNNLYAISPKFKSNPKSHILMLSSVLDVFNIKAGTIDDRFEENQTDITKEIDDDLARDKKQSVRYDKSFTAILSQASDNIKFYYNRIKNEILSYKDVETKINWKSEEFTYDSNTLVVLQMNEKSINVFLKLAKDSFDNSKYKAEDTKIKAFSETNITYKVKNDQRLEYVLELIDILFKDYSKLDNYKFVDYDVKYQTIDELIEKGLIKCDKSYEYQEINDGQDDASNKLENSDYDEFGRKIVTCYNSSFLSRYIQASENIKEYYSVLKNKILSIDGIKSGMYWNYESFKKGSLLLAKIDIKDKTIYFYTNLFFNDIPEDIRIELARLANFQDTKILFKIEEKFNLENAFRLIDILINKYELKTTENEHIEYYTPYKTQERLIEEKLIKKSRRLRGKGERIILEVHDENEYKMSITYKMPNNTTETIEYRKSFEARLINANQYVKSCYETIKNTIMSTIGTVSVLSWDYDTISNGKTNLMRFDVIKDKLYVYLPLEKNEVRKKYRLKLIDDIKMPGFKTCMVVGGIDFGLEAIELCYDVINKYNLEIKETQTESYALNDEDTLSLIKKSLVKEIIKKPKNKEDHEG